VGDSESDGGCPANPKLHKLIHRSRVKKSNWYLQYANRVYREPRWTKATNPVTENVDDPDNNAWWKTNIELRCEILSNWLEREVEIDDRLSCAVAVQSDSSSNPTFCPRIRNNFNHTSAQYAGMEVAISEIVKNMDDLRSRRHQELLAAKEAVRDGRMEDFELDELKDMWNQHVKDASEELDEALE
jgi:hypothetical protein